VSVAVVLSVCAVLCVVAIVVDRLFGRFVTARIREVFENVPPFGVVPAEQSQTAKTVQIETRDGLTLSGSLHRPLSDAPPVGLVIFCPELNGNHWMAGHYCQALLQHGFMVLGFDFRNQGDSDSQPDYIPIHWATEFELSDVDGVLEFIESDQQLSDLPLGIFGVSRGGVVALAAACRHPRIRAVMADSSFGTMTMTRHFVERFGRYIIPEYFFSLLPTWHINRNLRHATELSERKRGCRYVHLENEVGHLDDTAIRLVSGKRDSYVSPAVATSLAELFGGKELLWVVDKAKHNMARTVSTEEYDRYVLDHFGPIAISSNSAAATAEQPAGIPAEQSAP